MISLRDWYSKLRSRFQHAALTAEFAKGLWRDIWGMILPSIPFAEAYKDRLRAAIRTEQRQEIARFVRLRCVPRAEKKRLLRRVARAESRLALVSVSRTRVERTSVGLVLLLMLAASTIDGTARSGTEAWSAWYAFDPVDSILKVWTDLLTQHPAQVFAPGFGMFLLTLLVLAFYLNRSNDYPALPMFGVLIAILALGLFIYEHYLERGALSESHQGVVFTAMFISGLAALYFLLLLGAMIGTLFKIWRKKLYPDALIIDGLLTVLHKLENEPDQWCELGFRRELASRLDEVAYSMQSGLPSRLRTGDLVMDTWLKRTSLHQASAVRALKKWLAVPKKDTREHLIQKLAETFMACSGGDWDALERQEPETLTRSDHYMRIGTILRTTIVAVFPVALLFLYSEFSGQMATGSLQVLAILWGAGTVLSAVDPLFGARVTVFKDLLDAVPSKTSK